MSNVKAGGAYVEITANSAKLQKGLAGAQRSLARFRAAAAQSTMQAAKAFNSLSVGIGAVSASFLSVGMGFFGVGAAMGGALGLVVKGAIAAADEIEKMSIRTGASIEWLSLMKYAAEQTSVGIGDVGKSLIDMNKSLGDAAVGTGRALPWLERLGIGLDELADKSTEERFDRIAGALAGITDRAVKTRAATAIFRGGGESLLPMLEPGQLEALRKAGIDKGAFRSADEVKSLVALSDAITDLEISMASLSHTVAATLAPVLTGMVNMVEGLVNKWREFIQANKGLIAAVSLAIPALLGIGGAFMAAGLALKPFAIGFGILGKGALLLAGVLRNGLFPVLTGLAASLLKVGRMAALAVKGIATVSATALKMAGSAIATAGITSMLAGGALVAAAAITAYEAFKLAAAVIKATLGAVVQGARAMGELLVAAAVGVADTWKRAFAELPVIWEQMKSLFQAGDLVGGVKLVAAFFSKAFVDSALEVVSAFDQAFAHIKNAVTGVALVWHDVFAGIFMDISSQIRTIVAGLQTAGLALRAVAADFVGFVIKGLVTIYEKFLRTFLRIKGFFGFNTDGQIEESEKREQELKNRADSNVARLYSGIGEPLEDAAKKNDAAAKRFEERRRRLMESAKPGDSAMAESLRGIQAGLARQIEELRGKAAEEAGKKKKSMGKGLGASAMKAQPSGSFFTKDLATLFGNKGPEEETAKNTRQTASALATLIDLIRNSDGLTFS